MDDLAYWEVRLARIENKMAGFDGRAVLTRNGEWRSLIDAHRMVRGLVRELRGQSSRAR